MVRKVWLGDDLTRSLTVGDKVATREDDEKARTFTLTEGQLALLERRGHRFADPGSDEAQEPVLVEPPTGTPPIPATAAAATGATTPAAAPKK